MPTAQFEVPIEVPKDKPRITLPIRLPDRTLAAEMAAKSLRKAQTAIHDARTQHRAYAARPSSRSPKSRQAHL
jgi:hypothetical protein